MNAAVQEATQRLELAVEISHARSARHAAALRMRHACQAYFSAPTALERNMSHDPNRRQHS